MTRRVAFSRDARADLREITRLSLDRFGPTVAAGYVAGLRAACKKLGAFPSMAPIHPLADPPARMLVHRSRRVFHRVTDDRVLILRILHHAPGDPARALIPPFRMQLALLPARAAAASIINEGERTWTWPRDWSSWRSARRNTASCC